MDNVTLYFPQNNVIDAFTKDFYNKYWQNSNFVLGVISIIALMYETLVVRIFRECERCLMRWMKALPTKLCITPIFYEQCVPINDVIYTR